MDGQTGLLLAFQLLALCSIAGALVLYLLCKVRGTRAEGPLGSGAVIITAADTALGLQLTTHLASRGYRVFAGMRDPSDGVPSKLLRNWLKVRERETQVTCVIPLCLDVAREDVLQEAVESVTQHLPAGERGVLAVINTSGTVYRGRLEKQESAHWEAMFKTNILGYIRSARAFTLLLRPTRGRFIAIGASTDPTPDGDGLVAFQATRSAVEGASKALKTELQQLGIDVVILKPDGILAESLFAPPVPHKSVGTEKDVTQYSASVLGPMGLRAVENALADTRPAEFYSLAEKVESWRLTSSYCSTRKSNTTHKVQCTV